MDRVVQCGRLSSLIFANDAPDTMHFPCQLYANNHLAQGWLSLSSYLTTRACLGPLHAPESWSSTWVVARNLSSMNALRTSIGVFSDPQTRLHAACHGSAQFKCLQYDFKLRVQSSPARIFQRTPLFLEDRLISRRSPVTKLSLAPTWMLPIWHRLLHPLYKIHLGLIEELSNNAFLIRTHDKDDGGQAKSRWEKVPRRKSKTYSSRDSHVVTHRSTNLPFNCLCMAERTGCPVFSWLWPYVLQILF